MSTRRVLKVAEAIREVVGMAILVDLHDPRIGDVTVTRVSVSGDLRHAKVYVSIMGDDKKQSLCMHGLDSSIGYLQRKVSDRVDLRYTPRLQFVLDRGIKNALAVTQILDEVLPDQPAPNDEPPDTLPDRHPATGEAAPPPHSPATPVSPDSGGPLPDAGSPKD